MWTDLNSIEGWKGALSSTLSWGTASATFTASLDKLSAPESWTNSIPGVGMVAAPVFAAVLAAAAKVGSQKVLKACNLQKEEESTSPSATLVPQITGIALGTLAKYAIIEPTLGAMGIGGIAAFAAIAAGTAALKTETVRDYCQAAVEKGKELSSQIANTLTPAPAPATIEV